MPRHRRSAWMPPLSDDSRLPFMIKCSSGGHKVPRLLHCGILATASTAPSIEWVEHGTTAAPPTWQQKDGTDPKVTLRCEKCRLDRQMRESLLIKAVWGLAAAGLKDGSGRVTLDIAQVPR